MQSESHSNAASQSSTAWMPDIDQEPLSPSSTMGQGTMAVRNPTKHELKTAETRERLLEAALEIFLRDGYERADLAEIASLAGRTKGAIYAQFKSKEDIFFALVEKHALQHRAEIQEALARSSTIAGNLALFRKAFIKFAADEEWGFLLFEFKLYTIRHPDVKERLKRVYENIIATDEEATYTALLGSPGKGKTAYKRATAVHAGFAMLSGLRVQAQFGGVLDKRTIEKMAGQLFDMLFDSN